MAEKLESLVSSIKGLSLIEVADLVKRLEEELGVSAAAPMMMAAPAAGGAVAAAEEKTEFNVVLKSAGDKKLEVIKELRAITNLGLKEAKDLSEQGGVVKADVSKDEATKIKAQLEKAGAVVELS